jgi:hypothetical protein
MKKLSVLSVLLCSFLATACGSVRPDAGHESVLVYKPFIFGSGGCGPDVIKTGLTWVAASTSGVEVNVQPRQQLVTLDDLMTSDGVPLDFQASIQYVITDSRKLVCEFGADDSPNGMGFFQRTLLQPFLAITRNAVKRHGLNEMAINVSASEAVDVEVTKNFQQVVSETGAPIKLLGITLGRANPPDAIKSQRIETAEQQQRVLTERQKGLAEDERATAERKRATADKAYNNEMGINTEQWLGLQRIQAFRETCGNGKCTIVTDGVNGLVSIK